ncbi:MAG: HEAT repeat domain-containing protein [Pirellulales bacterium]|nr:HEAT repeat domain-containing protein [Pirellulales bacterium]
METALEQLVVDLAKYAELTAAERAALAKRIAALGAATSGTTRGHGTGDLLDAASLRTLEQTYQTPETPSAKRGLVLALLATVRSAEALRLFADLFVELPPADIQDVLVGCAPLMKVAPFPVRALYPRLLDALGNPQTAAVALDLANFATREGIVPRHPAADRAVELADLLGRIAQQLLRIEEQPASSAADVEDRRAQVSVAMPLFVSLCDALALIGDKTVIGKLHQALGIGHRRLRTEAAAALARLEEERGFETLVELAADPASRTRALAYLTELGQLERVAEALRSPEARAAAALADWLGHAAQFGAPPHEVELVDQCRQYWPGYNEPVDCWLFLYTYHFAQGEFSGVGIVGPVTYALQSDLEDLPPSDIYAAYAGWHAEHDDLRETSAADLPPHERSRAIAQIRAAIGDDSPYEAIELDKVGQFFNERILVAQARRGGQRGTLVIDDDGAVSWYPAGSVSRPIGPDVAYWIHTGRKLLATFNAAGRDDAD